MLGWRIRWFHFFFLAVEMVCLLTLKFIYSEKAPKHYEILKLFWRYKVISSDIWRFRNFLRIYELYNPISWWSSPLCDFKKFLNPLCQVKKVLFLLCHHFDLVGIRLGTGNTSFGGHPGCCNCGKIRDHPWNTSSLNLVFYPLPQWTHCVLKCA